MLFLRSKARVKHLLKEEKILLLFILIAAILRIPSLFEPFWYGDEGIYLTLGEGLRKGLVWYRDIHDNKPPALYFLAALAGNVFWFRLILLFWHTLSIVLFWDLAKILFQKFTSKNYQRAVISATALYTLLTAIPLLEGNIANAEIFMVLPTIAAMLILLRGKLSALSVFLAGLLFSFAFLFKVPSAFDLAAIVAFWGLLFLRREVKFKNLLSQTLVLTSGFLLPILVTSGYYFLQGALNEYLIAAFFQNIGYLSSWTAPGPESPRGFASQSGLLLRAGILALILFLVFLAKKHFTRPTLFIVVWLSFALFGALLSERPYPHYLIQVVPPVVLSLATLGFGSAKQRFLPIPMLLILVFSTVYFEFYYFPTFSYYANFLSYATGQKQERAYLSYFDSRVPQTNKVAELLSDRTGPNEKAFIWGDEPYIYAKAKRLPVGHYTATYHVVDFNGYKETMAALRAEKPKYIIVMEYEERPFPEFKEYLEQNYFLIERVERAQIWRRVNDSLREALFSRTL